MRHSTDIFRRLKKTLLISDFGACVFHEEPSCLEQHMINDESYRLSARLILRMGLPGPLSGEPMLFLLSLVGEGGAGFPICKNNSHIRILITFPYRRVNYAHVPVVQGEARCHGLKSLCILDVIVLCTHCERSAIDGLSQPCRAES